MRYRLRTLLILMAVAAIVLAWIGHSLRWIKERNDWRDNPRHIGFEVMFEYLDSNDPTKAPGGLWVFGEEGAGTIWCLPEQLETVRRIYPEGEIRVRPMSPAAIDERKAELAEEVRRAGPNATPQP